MAGLSLYLVYLGQTVNSAFYSLSAAFGGVALFVLGTGFLSRIERFSPIRFFLSQLLMVGGMMLVFTYLNPTPSLQSTTCFELGSFSLAVTGIFIVFPRQSVDSYDTILLFSITATVLFFLSGVFLSLQEILSKVPKPAPVNQSLSNAINSFFIAGVLDLLVVSLLLYVVLYLRRRTPPGEPVAAHPPASGPSPEVPASAGVLPKRVALILRGPPGSGKTPVREILRRELLKLGPVREEVLDIHSGVTDDNRHRSYHNLDSLHEPYILIECGYGGDATKCPNIWVDKLRSQGFEVNLYLLNASIEELKRRTSSRPPEWKEEFTVDGWKRYKTDPDALDFARRLSLPETEIDTTAVPADVVAKLILDRLSLKP